ncbi:MULTISPECIES: hypothetical protein [unclassified Frankia]
MLGSDVRRITLLFCVLARRVIATRPTGTPAAKVVLASIARAGTPVGVSRASVSATTGGHPAGDDVIDVDALDAGLSTSETSGSRSRPT